MRQKFTEYERDTETGLDYAEARYYASTQGRFTSIDPLLASAHASNPQSWNRYSYALNKPTKMIDPNGLAARSVEGNCSAEFGRCDEEEGGSEAEAEYEHGLHNTRDTISANHAAQNGDMDTFWEIVDNNEDLWVTSIHNRIINEAFQGLTTDQKNQLKKASAEVDEDQSTEGAYKHAMRAPGQSELAAALNATFFVLNAMLEARRLQREYQANGGTGFSDQALFAVGKAIHTLTDSTSPSHRGFQVWRGTDDLVSDLRAVRHIWGELRISPTQMRNAVSMAQMPFPFVFGRELSKRAFVRY